MPKGPVPAAATGLPASEIAAALEPMPWGDADEYCLMLSGDFLMPDFNDGAALMFDAREVCEQGDIVAMWLQRDPLRSRRVRVGRLVTYLPRGVTLPYRDHPESEVRLIIVGEELNPCRQFEYRCSSLLAIHKCMGLVPSDRRRKTAAGKRTRTRADRDITPAVTPC